MGTMNRGFTVLSMLPINSNQFNLRMWLIIWKFHNIWLILGFQK
jgi:hypothetical protein